MSPFPVSDLNCANRLVDTRILASNMMNNFFNMLYFNGYTIPNLAQRYNIFLKYANKKAWLTKKYKKITHTLAYMK